MKKYIIKVIIAGAILAASSCDNGKKEEEKLLRPVKWEKVGYSNGAIVRTFSGTAEMDKTIDLSFRTSGILSQFDLTLGQSVKKGQLLARLDNVQARLAHQQALTALNSAESQFNTAKLSLDRSRALYEKGSASLSQYEAAKNAYKTAQQSYESAKSGVDIQQEQIEYGLLYAPWDGVIASVNAEINENVGPGQPIATLNAGTTMEISLGLPESVINHVKMGDTLNVEFTSLPDMKMKAIVSELSPSISPTTATYPLRARLIGKSEAIKSGMSADVTIDLNGHSPTRDFLVVPTYAIGEDTDGRFVFLIQREADLTKVKKQKIEIGPLTSKGFEVRSGVKAGELIATAGLQTLLDGQEVRF